MIDAVGREHIGFDDFRSNGLLLPASDDVAVSLGLPLHRGPHNDYNAMVMTRVGSIERLWSRHRLRDAEWARRAVLVRIDLLQKALRKRLLDQLSLPLQLSRFDPQRRTSDFAHLDAMVDALWGATANDGEERAAHRG